MLEANYEILAHLDHLGTQIFNFLNFNDQLKCRKVCKSWQKLINRNKSWCQNVISRGRMKLRTSVDFSSFVEWTSLCKEISDLGNKTSDLACLASLIQAFFVLKSDKKVTRFTRFFDSAVLGKNLEQIQHLWPFLDSKQR